MTPVTVGIDIGGTNTKFGIADRDGTIIASNSMRTPRDKSIEIYIEELSQAIKQLFDLSTFELQIDGIGIGAPNANYYEGTIEDAPNLIWDGKIPFVEMVQQHFDVPTVITNDANAAAMGEQVFGGAKDMDNFIIITLGTGVGSGFIVNGDLVYGHDGFAGEFGHVITQWGGRPCTCGRRGCVEAYASARGVVATVLEELAGSKADSKLRHLHYQEITPKAIFEAAEEGDPIAARAFEYTGKMLGQALANLIALYSPKAIFLFGGVARAGKWIIDPTKKYMEENLMSVFKNKVSIIPSSLPESDAAILGASALAWKELDKLGMKVS